MRKTIMGWVVTTLALTAVLAVPSDGQSQASQGTHMAVALEDLLIVANLKYGTGDTKGAMAALESAGSRALGSGDAVRAADMFADAAWVAKKAGLRIDQRRLSSRVGELADSSELTRAERNQILSRFRGH